MQIEFFQDIKTISTVVHVLSVVLSMGSALASDFLFSFFSRDKKLNKTEITTLSILSKTVLAGLVIICISGVFIFLSHPEKYLESTKFMAKMSILAILLINGFLLNKMVWPHLMKKSFFKAVANKIRSYAFVFGAVSVTSWLAVCTLGVLDSIWLKYSEIMLLYLVILGFAIICALFVEKLEFGK